jgi:hypothetical protein
LLGDLKAEGLGTLCVVRTDVDVDERPVLVLGGQFGGQPVHIVIVTVNGDQRAVVHGRREYLCPLQRGRDQDH